MLAPCVLLMGLTQSIGFGWAQSTISLSMPNVQTIVKDTVLCTSFQMQTQDFEYIVEFEANVDPKSVHHMLVIGCKNPGYWERDSPRIAWECSTMGIPKNNTLYPKAGVCSGTDSSIIYGWAKSTQIFEIPTGVAFKVGAGSEINYLVLQLHYLNVDKFVAGETDNSGVTLRILPSNTNRVNSIAGLLVLGSVNGTIPSKGTEHFESACMHTENITIHPFAFITHTHHLGKIVAGYVIKPNGTWQLIGKLDQQQPEMFSPVPDKGIEINKGDVLAGTCTFYNYRNITTKMGYTDDDEMCLFALLYYVSGDKLLHKKSCLNLGPQEYSWQKDQLIDDVPDWVLKDSLA